MRRYGRLPGRKFTAARAIVGGVALLAGLFIAVGPARATESAPAAVPSGASVTPAAAVPVAARTTSATAVQAGEEYVIGDEELCSTGFAVTTATGQSGFVTAGHCGLVGDQVQAADGTSMGTVAAVDFPGTDYGWVHTNPQYAPASTVSKHNGTVAAIHGDVAASVGSPVCVSGHVSGWHCGTITAINQSVTYEQGVVSGLTSTNVCTDYGDSGGVFVSGDQAQGIISGGIGDCSSNGTTYFQPVQPVLQAYGLTLQTH